jgi:N-acyl-D-amino-acid deacylase
MPLDVVIRNARVVDGTGNPWFSGSVGVRDGRIVEIDRGGLLPKGSVDFPAEGKVLTPGFFDIHRHSDWTLLVGPSAESAIEQGLTTEVIGNCGYGPAPAADRKRVEQHILGYNPEHGVEIDWTTFGEFLARLDDGLALNVVPLVAHGPIRTSAMGVAERNATGEEIKRMCYWVDEAMDAGAFGISTGLEYPPYRTASTTDEIVALARRVAAKGGLYVTHVRERWFDVVSAVEEAVEIARASGARLQVSHITARALARHLTEPLLEICKASRDEGIDASFDTYPYEWAPGPVYELLPEWAVAGSTGEVAQRFRNEEFREKVKREHRKNLVRWVQLERWDKVMIVDAPHDRESEGRTILELAEERDREPWDVVFDLLAAARRNWPNIVELIHSLDWDDILQTVADPNCSIGSDAVTLTRQGPLAHSSLHPGAYGFVPRAFDELVTARNALSFEEAVRRMTSLPASQLGVWDRGVIRPGMAADLVLLDPDTFHDNTSSTDFNARPSGVELVLVNGRVAVDKGRCTGVRAGGVLQA